MSGQTGDELEMVDEPNQPIDRQRDAESDSQVKRRRPGFRISPLVWLLLFLLLSAAVVVWIAANEAKKVPEFYQVVLNVDPETAAVQGAKLEQNLVRLQNAARTKRPWRVELTQDQINGWLVSDLPEKFPGSLPEQIRDPRVSIDDEQIKFVFKFATDQLEGIVVVEADVFCTEVENEVAVKISDVRSGFVSLPIAPWVQRVSDIVESMGIPIYWMNEGDAPVAIFTIPEFMTPQGSSRNAIIDSISLRPSKLVVAGQTKMQVEKMQVEEVAELSEGSSQH